MTDTIDAYVKATDEAADFVTHQLAKIYPQALEDIDDLFRSVDNRDPELWDELDVDSEITVDEYEVEEDRDLDWILGMAGISAASLTQFTIDNAETLIFEPVAYKEQLLEPFKLTEKQLISAGKRGAVATADVVTEFVTIKKRFLTDLNVLRKLDTVELYRTLVRYDAMIPMDKLMADAAGYVSRMTAYRAGSTQWKEAVSNLVDFNSKRALTGMTRRSVERIHSYREADGVGSVKMVWIGEGGKNTCGFCLDNYGVVKTYDQWTQDGMPGADICAGGDLCKCGLAATT